MQIEQLRGAFGGDSRTLAGGRERLHWPRRVFGKGYVRTQNIIAWMSILLLITHRW
jgi:hypothetical protein